MMVWVLGLVHGAQEVTHIVFTQPKKSGGGMEEISIPLDALQQCREAGHKILQSGCSGTMPPCDSLTSCSMWSAALHAALRKLQVGCQVFEMGSDVDNNYHRGVRIQERIVIDLQGRQWSDCYGASKAYHRGKLKCIHIPQEGRKDYYFYFATEGDFNIQTTMMYPGFELHESLFRTTPLAEVQRRLREFKPARIPEAVHKSLMEKAYNEQHGLLFALRATDVRERVSFAFFVYVENMANTFHSILEGAVLCDGKTRPIGPSAYTVGQTVEIHGLVGAPQHNGKSGTVLRYVKAKGRYEVQLDSDKRLGLKPANLKAEPLTVLEQLERAIQDGKKLFVDPAFQKQLRLPEKLFRELFVAQKKLNQAK